MRGLPVELIRADADSGLLPRLDTETQFLTWSASTHDSWTLGFNVDGLVIVDCNSHRVARNIDLIIPKHLWQSASLPEPSLPADRCALQFPQSLFEAKTVEVPVTVQSDDERVHVMFGSSVRYTDAFRLGDDAWAAVHEGHLVALGATLPEQTG